MTQHDQFDTEGTPALGVSELTHGDPVAVQNDWGDEQTIILPPDTDGALRPYLQDLDSGDWFAVSVLPCRIGRQEDCELRFQDPGMSRHHATISRVDDGFVLEDAGSSNGLKVNDYKLERTVLADGDEITIGSRRLGFCFGKAWEAAGLSTQGGDSATDAPAMAATLRSLASRSSERVKDGFAATVSGGRLPYLLALLAIPGVVIATGVVWRADLEGRVMTSLSSTHEGAEVVGSRKSSQPTKTEPAVAADEVAGSANAGSVNGSAVIAADGEARKAMGTVAAKNGGMMPAVIPGASIEQPQMVATAAMPEASQTVRPASGHVRPVNQPVVTTAAGKEVPVNSAPKQAPSGNGKASVPSAPKVAAKQQAPAKKKKSRKVSSKKGRMRVDQARELYLNGDAPSALSTLDRIAGSKRYRGKDRDSARALRRQLAAAYQEYETGNSAFQRGDTDGAFKKWIGFLQNEKSLVLSRKSRYYDEILTAVVQEYTRRGNEAQANGDSRTAFTMWQRAARIDTRGEAAATLASLNGRARELYREAYRLETANVERSKELWRQVVNLAAPGSEYHAKATAKLRWYEHVQG